MAQFDMYLPFDRVADTVRSEEDAGLRAYIEWRNVQTDRTDFVAGFTSTTQRLAPISGYPIYRASYDGLAKPYQLRLVYDFFRNAVLTNAAPDEVDRLDALVLSLGAQLSEYERKEQLFRDAADRLTRQRMDAL